MRSRGPQGAQEGAEAAAVCLSVEAAHAAGGGDPGAGPGPGDAGSGSQTTVAEAGRPVSAEAIGVTLLDLAKRYPGLTLTVNGAAVRSLCLNVRVLINGTEDMSPTLDLEVG